MVATEQVHNLGLHLSHHVYAGSIIIYGPARVFRFWTVYQYDKGPYDKGGISGPYDKGVMYTLSENIFNYIMHSSVDLHAHIVVSLAVHIIRTYIRTNLAR